MVHRLLRSTGPGRPPPARSGARGAGVIPGRDRRAVLGARAGRDEGRARRRRLLLGALHADKIGEKFKASSPAWRSSASSASWRRSSSKASSRRSRWVRTSGWTGEAAPGGRVVGPQLLDRDEVLVEVVSADPARRRIALALANGGAVRSGSGSRPRTSALRRGRSRAGRARRLLRQRRVGLRASHRLAARIVVKEHESAVDEGPEVCGPPDRVSSSFTSSARRAGSADMAREATGRGAAPSEVDDLRGRWCLLRHAPALSQPQASAIAACHRPGDE